MKVTGLFDLIISVCIDFFIIRNNLTTSNNLTIPKLFMVAFNTVAKPLMPEKIQNMINFHSDFQSLHEFVSKMYFQKNLQETLGNLTIQFVSSNQKQLNNISKISKVKTNFQTSFPQQMSNESFKY